MGFSARDFFWIGFGGKNSVYLLHAREGGYIDEFYPSVCFFAVVSGEGDFWVSERIQCPEGSVGRYDQARVPLSDHSGFEIDGASLRWRSKSPLSYAGSDLGHFELRGKSLRALRPHLSPAELKARFAANPRATVEALEAEARLGRDGALQETGELSLDCRSCDNEADKYCFPWDAASSGVLLDRTREPPAFALALGRACQAHDPYEALEEDTKQAASWPRPKRSPFPCLWAPAKAGAFFCGDPRREAIGQANQASS